MHDKPSAFHQFLPSEWHSQTHTHAYDVSTVCLQAPKNKFPPKTILCTVRIIILAVSFTCLMWLWANLMNHHPPNHQFHGWFRNIIKTIRWNGGCLVGFTTGFYHIGDQLLPLEPSSKFPSFVRIPVAWSTWSGPREWKSQNHGGGWAGLGRRHMTHTKCCMDVRCWFIPKWFHVILKPSQAISSLTS